MTEIISINSVERATNVHKQTQTFLDADSLLVSQINDHLRAFRSLLNLIPKLFSGHLFPCIEAVSEIENAILVSSLGFYKLGFITLRNVLELSLLSVYFDRSGDSEKKIQRWLKSKDNTPFFNSVCQELFALENFQKIQSSCDLELELKSLFYKLSDYSHTKGYKFSNHGLGNNFSNFNVFNEKIFLEFIEQFKDVTRMSVVLHLIRYPVGLLHTPLFQKFGFDSIMGTFIEPWEGELLRSVVKTPLIDILQNLAYSDREAQSLARYINDFPDLTEQEISTTSLSLKLSNESSTNY